MSGATDVYAMFRGARQFNQDLSAWVSLASVAVHAQCLPFDAILPLSPLLLVAPFSFHRMLAVSISLVSCLQIVRDSMAIYPAGMWEMRY